MKVNITTNNPTAELQIMQVLRYQYLGVGGSLNDISMLTYKRGSGLDTSQSRVLICIFNYKIINISRKESSHNKSHIYSRGGVKRRPKLIVLYMHSP